MSDRLSATLTSAVNVYIDAPTGAHRDNLISAADEYLQLWIGAQANKGPASKKRSSHRTPTSYDRRHAVTRGAHGIPVTLALQERDKQGEEHWVLSWRARYFAGGPNRRFYRLNNGIWTIPAAIALEMFEEMEVYGGLKFEKYPDPRPHEIEISVSTEMTPAKKEEALAQLTLPDEDFGSDPFFVFVSDPKPTVTKAMIVDTVTDTVTFRSITEDPDYMPKKDLNRGPGRWLDNSMMDANVQQMAGFYETLRDYLGRK